MVKFEKISYEQFEKDYVAIFGDEIEKGCIKNIYDGLRLPRRSTTGSCGYDFFSPFEFILEEPNAELIIPTGIRAIMDDDKFLMITPRSGLGTRHYMRLANTIGIVDSDYSKSDNEGHIFIKYRLENHNSDSVNVKTGMAIAQGIFMNYLKTNDDDADGVRNGGFGSTDKK